MPRATRIEYEGAIHHVMARGNRRLPIVFSGSDHEFRENYQPGRRMIAIGG